MKHCRESKISILAFSLFFVALVGYASYEARGVLRGPQIVVEHSVLETHEPSVSIKGTTQHIASLSMNGTPVPVTENGAFDQMYIASKGYNRVLLHAKDKYGHTTDKTVEIVYTPESLTIGNDSLVAAAALALPQATSSERTLSSKTLPQDVDESESITASSTSPETAASAETMTHIQ